MKKVIYAILVMILSVPLSGYTVKGGVTYTVETARKEAFADVEYTLPKSIINAHKTDPNYKENMKAKSNGVNRLSDRYITYYDDGGYGIVYKANRYYEFYYYPNGKLELIGKRTSLVRPCKSYKYNIKAELEEIVLYVDKENSYIFTPTGQLKVHWFGKKGYDMQGNIIIEEY